MTPYSLRQKAEEMEISYPAAVMMRKRYLVSQIEANWLWMYEETNDIPPIMLKDAHNEHTALHRSLEVNTKGNLTEDMIQRAREADIRPLFEWTRGRTLCPFHEDKRPSAYYGNRSQRLVCPVCNQTWDALAILQLRDGKNFMEAVKELCG